MQQEGKDFVRIRSKRPKKWKTSSQYARKIPFRKTSQCALSIYLSPESSICHCRKLADISLAIHRRGCRGVLPGIVRVRCFLRKFAAADARTRFSWVSGLLSHSAVKFADGVCFGVQQGVLAAAPHVALLHCCFCFHGYSQFVK